MDTYGSRTGIVWGPTGRAKQNGSSASREIVQKVCREKRLDSCMLRYGLLSDRLASAVNNHYSLHEGGKEAKE